MPVTFDDLKNRLRAAFIANKRRKTPEYRGGEALEKALDPAARNCIKAKITPEDYCAALYQAYGGTYDDYWPNQMTGNKALSIATKYASNYEAVAPDKLWAAQVGLMRQALVSTKRTVEELLFDRAVAFSPWFRVIATVEPNREIIAKYGKEAKAQLTPELKTFLLSSVAAPYLDRITNYERYL
ncbi:hypothetical protein EKK58_01165 [Candidatus Dependentiae bacterium]|nr:MAG: hypothetical protein EKK58_01165 [Candidatus Dependentiae bacterium]